MNILLAGYYGSGKTETNSIMNMQNEIVWIGTVQGIKTNTYLLKVNYLALRTL